MQSVHNEEKFNPTISQKQCSNRSETDPAINGSDENNNKNNEAEQYIDDETWLRDIMPLPPFVSASAA